MSTKKIFMVLVMSVFVLASAQATMAAGYEIWSGTGGPINGWGPWQANNGGEFSLAPTGTPSLNYVLGYYVAGVTKGLATVSGLPTFQTFCLEESEFIYNPGKFNAVVSDSAVYGGVGPAGDPISKGTAYLYSQFAAGTLAYDYANAGTGRLNDAAALQNAIWFLEGEGGVNNAYVALAAAQFGSLANALLDANGLFGVKALNLTDSNGRVQDMLVVVPIPGAVWLLGSGLLGLLGFKRKFVS